MSKLDEIEARLRAATPGPWQEFAESGDWWVEQSDGKYNGTGKVIGASPDWQQADLDLAMAAPSDLAALLRVARASEKLDRASEVVHNTPMMTTAYSEAVDAANVAYEEWRAALAALESEATQ